MRVCSTLFSRTFLPSLVNFYDLTRSRVTQATVDFEAQDEAVLAKILVPAGTPDVAVGTPMMVLIENADDAPAFKDFAAEGASADAPAASESAPAPAPAPAADPAPAPAPSPTPESETTPASAPSTSDSARIAASPLAKSVSSRRVFVAERERGSEGARKTCLANESASTFVVLLHNLHSFNGHLEAFASTCARTEVRSQNCFCR